MLQAQHGRYEEYMSKEADMRRELQRYITTLEVGIPGCLFISQIRNPSSSWRDLPSR